MAIFLLLLIQVVKKCTLSTGYLPLGGLPRYSVARITDLYMTAVDRGCTAPTQNLYEEQ